MVRSIADDLNFLLLILMSLMENKLSIMMECFFKKCNFIYEKGQLSFRREKGHGLYLRSFQYFSKQKYFLLRRVFSTLVVLVVLCALIKKAQKRKHKKERKGTKYVLKNLLQSYYAITILICYCNLYMLFIQKVFSTKNQKGSSLNKL